jgi:hypothetical protein
MCRFEDWVCAPPVDANIARRSWAEVGHRVEVLDRLADYSSSTALVG